MELVAAITTLVRGPWPPARLPSRRSCHLPAVSVVGDAGAQSRGRVCRLARPFIPPGAWGRINVGRLDF